MTQRMKEVFDIETKSPKLNPVQVAGLQRVTDVDGNHVYISPNTIKAFLDANVTINDVNHLKDNSYVNHHVEGLDYLCLYRKSGITIKAYFIDKVSKVNKFSNYLVNPHSHVYSFHSMLLTGRMNHHTFSEDESFDTTFNHFYNANKYTYTAKTRKVSKATKVLLYPDTVTEFSEFGESYYLHTTDIHTIEILEDKTVLLLVQAPTTEDKSELYLPIGQSYSTSRPTRKMTYYEYLTRYKEFTEIMKKGNMQ